PPVLTPTQQYVSRYRPLHASQKASMLGEERDLHTVLGAAPQQEWTARNLPETNDAGEGLDGHPHLAFFFHAHVDALAVARQPRALGGHIEAVQELAHGVTPSWLLPDRPARRATRPACAAGRCSSASSSRNLWCKPAEAFRGGRRDPACARRASRFALDAQS